MTISRSLRFALVAATLALPLAACETDKSVLAGGSSIVASITNPVGSVDLWRAKNAYASALTIATKYREFCYARSYAVLMADPIAGPACKSRRANIRRMQAADVKAAAAIRAAENFVAQNPTVSAVSLVNAAWTAVTDFQKLAAQSAVQ